MWRFAAQSDVFWRQSERSADRRTRHVRHWTEGRQRNSEYHLLRFRYRDAAPVDDRYKVCTNERTNEQTKFIHKRGINNTAWRIFLRKHENDTAEIVVLRHSVTYDTVIDYHEPS